MKQFVFFSGAVFAAVFAVVAGFRLSADAMAVVVGIVCGVLASIPMSAVLVWTLRLRDRQLQAQYGPGNGTQYPPVIVVNGQGTAGTSSAPPMLTANGGPRQFKIIGQESTEAASAAPIWEEI
ncbi:MAG: hypothetical protein D6784_05295 [Chloroflexi bacterium]|nr:MAG: hypothetical protein D6784_05295 [Chloroflexota bacterium]